MFLFLYRKGGEIDGSMWSNLNGVDEDKEDAPAAGPAWSASVWQSPAVPGVSVITCAIPPRMTVGIQNFCQFS